MADWIEDPRLSLRKLHVDASILAERTHLDSGSNSLIAPIYKYLFVLVLGQRLRYIAW